MAYMVGSHMYVYDGDTWVDAGELKGPKGDDGDSPYIHIKYSDDGGQTLTASNGETPGKYIGIYWDYSSDDSTNLSRYTWARWRGEDGFGYEYILTLTTDDTAPAVPTATTNANTGKTSADPDFVPVGWYDSMPSVSSSNPYCWVCYRRFQSGQWTAFIGSAEDPTKAALWAHYGENGTDGLNGVDGKDAKPVRIRNWSEVYGVTLTGNNKIFSGFEPNAPFRDVILITDSDYATSQITYPFVEDLKNVPVLLTVNFNMARQDGFDGTDLTLPIPGTNCTNDVASTLDDSALLTRNGYMFSVFQSLGALYLKLLVAVQGYIGALTVDHMTTTNGNNSYIEIQNGFIKVYDTAGVLRMEIGQGTNDTAPILKFYDSTGAFLYDLGPNGIRWQDKYVIGDGGIVWNNPNNYQYSDCTFGDKVCLGFLGESGDTLSAIYTMGSAADTTKEYYEFHPAIRNVAGHADAYYNYNLKQNNGWKNSSEISAFQGILVKTNQTFNLLPGTAGVNVELQVWPRTTNSLLTEAPADGWYMDNTDGFLGGDRVL